MRWGWIVVAGIAAELAAILLLFLVVFLFGPNNMADANAFALRMGEWVGPIGGFAMTLLAAWLVTRKLPSRQIVNGFAVGCAVVVVDVALLLAMMAPFEWLFVASDTGKIAAGTLGGYLASRTGAH